MKNAESPNTNPDRVSQCDMKKLKWHQSRAGVTVAINGTSGGVGNILVRALPFLVVYV